MKFEKLLESKNMKFKIYFSETELSELLMVSIFALREMGKNNCGPKYFLIKKSSQYERNEVKKYMKKNNLVD